MKLLAIETTCDETAAAVVTDQLEVLSSVVASQEKLHERFHGVVPEIAARAHLERILPVLEETLRRANCKLTDLDAIAVAYTPGLAGSLLVGVCAAKALCLSLGKPLVAVNHLHAHIYACRIAEKRDQANPGGKQQRGSAARDQRGAERCQLVCLAYGRGHVASVVRS